MHNPFSWKWFAEVTLARVHTTNSELWQNKIRCYKRALQSVDVGFDLQESQVSFWDYRSWALLLSPVGEAMLGSRLPTHIAYCWVCGWEGMRLVTAAVHHLYSSNWDTIRNLSSSFYIEKRKKQWEARESETATLSSSHETCIFRNILILSNNNNKN